MALATRYTGDIQSPWLLLPIHNSIPYLHPEPITVSSLFPSGLHLAVTTLREEIQGHREGVAARVTDPTHFH